MTDNINSKESVQRYVKMSQENESHISMNHMLSKNLINTAKYTVINFIPLNLFNQFKKVQNIFFTVITIMQAQPAITITNGLPTVGYNLIPLIALSMFKDAYEDYKRHVADDSENTRMTAVYNTSNKTFQQKQWRNIYPGEILKISNDEHLPCDILMLASSDENGLCYVETKNLDGETNLKIKKVHADMQDAFHEEKVLITVEGEIICEKPNNAIYKFEGAAHIKQIKDEVPLNAENLLLRGSSLRNTHFVYGLAIFTGHDTKVMLNNANAKYKFSSLEQLTNHAILIIVCCQIIVAFIAGLTGAKWISDYGTIYNYLDLQNNRTFLVLLLTKMGTWILVFTNFVPISLMVSLELVKFWQAMFMSYDYLMFDEEQDMPMKAQASNLNEELGQIEYVFSDKTGTLTSNIMEFKKFTAGSEAYGTGEKPQITQESNVNFHDPKLDQILSSQNAEERDPLLRVIMFLATCHTIIIDEQKGTYNSASPDELALVNAAKQFGWEFAGRDGENKITVKNNNNGEKYVYELLSVQEFTSDRKRMSCILRDPQNRIILMCKGADSVIEERLSKESKNSQIFIKTQSDVDKYAAEGLRTLYLAERYVDEQDFNIWFEKSRLAKLSLTNREEEVAKIDELIEIDLELIGSTAIEDRLQDQVADTIQFMKNVGIKVWVLTGDKIETAINIGVSAGLLDSTMAQFIVDQTDTDELNSVLKQIQKEINRMSRANSCKQAIIIAGASLVAIDSNKSLKEKFLGMSDNVDVVLACRVSPKQKADIVNWIRQRFPKKVTMAIGDGANDVNMILQAHVGIGILGKEGQQAARTADYAIGQFKFLKPLMFIHGREAYRRNSMMVKYSFFKSVMYMLPQFYFGFISGFSGLVFYEPIIYQLYNIFMTGLPIMYYCLFDFEFAKQKFLRFPNFYRIGMQNSCFSYKIFLQWLCYALVVGFCVYYVCFHDTVGYDQMGIHGQKIELWAAGNLTYGGSIFVANIVLLYKFNNIDGWNILTILSGIIAFFIASYVENGIKSIPDLWLVFPNLFSEGIAWIALLFIVGLMSVLELAHRACHHLIYNDSDLEVESIDQTKISENSEEKYITRSLNDSVCEPLQENNNEYEIRVQRKQSGYAFSAEDNSGEKQGLIKTTTVQSDESIGY